MDSREEAILKTLLYADIFDFPLAKQEIYTFLISDKKYQINLIYQSLKSSKLPINFKKNLFFLKGKEDLIHKRLERQKISEEKLKKAKKFIKIIGLLPSVIFIGISGGLSMKNADKEDDIDLFVITTKNLLWTSRFMLIILLNILGVARKRNSEHLADKICLNMLIDEESIYFNKEKQNLYSAHEIVQLIPVLDKENTYKKFITSNSWVNGFLPNISFVKASYSKKKGSIFDSASIFLLNILFLEKILKFIQFNYMKRRITKETVTQKYLAFHPFDYEEYVLFSYKKRLRLYGLK